MTETATDKMDRMVDMLGGLTSLIRRTTNQSDLDTLNKAWAALDRHKRQMKATSDTTPAAPLAKILKTLTYHEREIIKLRYGIGDGYTYTLEEVGKIFKVTRDRVRQVEAKGIAKLRRPGLAAKLRAALGDTHPLIDKWRIPKATLNGTQPLQNLQQFNLKTPAATHLERLEEAWIFLNECSESDKRFAGWDQPQHVADRMRERAQETRLQCESLRWAIEREQERS